VYFLACQHVQISTLNLTSSSAIAERPRCTVGQFWPKVEDDRSIFNHCDVRGLQSYRIRWNKAK